MHESVPVITPGTLLCRTSVLVHLYRIISVTTARVTVDGEIDCHDLLYTVVSVNPWESIQPKEHRDWFLLMGTPSGRLGWTLYSEDFTVLS